MKLARIVSIIMVLLQQKKITAVRLSEMFEVTTRTIYRDLEVINLAGIPVVTSPGVNGGLGIMEEYKVAKGLFTTADITSLLTGLGSLPLTSEDVLTTIAKIKGLAPKDHMRDIERKVGRVIVDHTPWSGRRSFQSHLEEIRAALEESRLLAFNYYDGLGRESTRRVEPYHLLLKESNWYLLAWCAVREDTRMFRLSRMSGLRVLNERFTPRELDFGPPDEPPPQTITLKLLVDESLRGWMADICGRENLEPRGDHKFLARFPFIESDYGYGMLLCFGDKCECLEPEPIRLEVKRRAAALSRLYQEGHGN